MVRNSAAAQSFIPLWKMHGAACGSYLPLHMKERWAATPAWQTQTTLCSLEVNAEMEFPFWREMWVWSAESGFVKDLKQLAI